jgi:choline-sulfatase
MTAPNILIFMVDQLNGTLFPDGPAEWLHAPNLKALAARSTRFANAYTASPLCAPGRASFMSGLLPSRSRVYDNAAEFAADIPTYAHHLRRAGYQTCLSGKMHFVGPDQLHGFEERLTTDIYPADFGWTPDYRKPGERIDWWYHNMGSVTGAGVAEISNQMEYDDEVAHNARAKVYDLARGLDARPWCLTVSFTHPHDPYVARKKYWDLYEDCDYLLPEVPAMAYADHDAHARRIFDANDWRNFEITEEDIRRSRRAYFANISYLDDKIGEVLEALETTRRYAGRAWVVVQNVFLRGFCPRAADDLGPRHGAGVDHRSGQQYRRLPDALRIGRGGYVRGHAVDRRAIAGLPRAGRHPRCAGRHGIRRRSLPSAACVAALWQVEIQPLHARSRSALRSGG